MSKNKAWNKGYTKYNHPSVFKISNTMQRKKLDNFSLWREKMRKAGKIKSNYPEFKKNGDLAELFGVILGDGHIGTFPRTESLRIVSHSDNKGFIKRYSNLVEKVFNKKPYVSKRKTSNCVDITIYEKNISKRLKIPAGSRKNTKHPIPAWILNENRNIKRYLRGLYEAEGVFCVHKPTYTYKFIFSNQNESLLNNVYKLLRKIGFHPHKSKYKIQISKKEEVYKAIEKIKFRKY